MDFFDSRTIKCSDLKAEIFNTAMLIVKREPEVSPKMYVYENWKSTNQTAIRGLMPHEIFSPYALDAVIYERSS
ncbi:MAG: hypothetical protein GQ554_04660 [Deltaproteobacteria bacterium]|nr:hypothetical protein [Deltaproteobacteria bacterium]